MTLPKALNLWKRGELWVLNLEYVTANVVPEGVYDRLQFTDIIKVQCVETLRQLFKQSAYMSQLFINLTAEVDLTSY